MGTNSIRRKTFVSALILESEKRQSGGFTLFFVLIASAIAATMAVAVSIRAYTGYTDVTKKALSTRARNAAESGLTILIESLNSDYPEWLVSSFDSTDQDVWNPRSLVGSGCNPDTEGNPIINGAVELSDNGTTSHYALTSYRFNGNEFYGGKGQFVMNGIVRSKDGKSLAEAQVVQEMQIMTKTCGALPGDTAGNERMWPGMFMNKISRYGYTEVIQKGTDPAAPATVLCTSETCAGKNANASYWKSDFPAWPPTVGDIKSPDALTPPKELEGVDIKTFSSKVSKILRSCKDFVIPDDLDEVSKSSWLKDDEGTTHVYLKGYSPGSIDGRNCRGKTKPAIKIKEGPVRLYVDSKSLKIGRNTWLDTTSVGHAADFMILGTQKEDDQTLQISGNSPNGETLKTFIWMPTGKIHFLLNSNSTDVRRIEGALWGREYMCTCDNALNNTAKITVPEDMPSLIFQRLGKEFGIGRRDFFAQGITNWRSHSRLKQ